MSWETSTIKCVVLIFNTFCGIFGIIFIVIAALEIFYGTEVDNMCIVFIIFGSILFLIAFFGCFGVIRQNEFLMRMYATLLTVLIIVNVVCLVISQDKFESETLFDLRHAFNSTRMHEFETKNKCCGIKGRNDYLKHNMSVPASCYSGANNTTYQDGCLEKMVADVATPFQAAMLISLTILVATFYFAGSLARHFLVLERRLHFKF